MTEMSHQHGNVVGFRLPDFSSCPSDDSRTLLKQGWVLVALIRFRYDCGAIHVSNYTLGTVQSSVHIWICNYNVSIQPNFIYVIRQIWDVFTKWTCLFCCYFMWQITCLSGLSSISLDRLHICLVFCFILHIWCSFCIEFPHFHGTRLPVCLVLCFMGWTAGPWPVCSCQLWQKQLTARCDGLFRRNSWRRMGFSQWRSWNSMQRTLPPPCTIYCWNAWVRAVQHKQTLGTEMNVCKYKGQLTAMLMIIIDYLWHPIL